MQGMYFIKGFLGMFVMLGIAILFSMNRKKISWKLVGLGTLLQFVFAILVLKTNMGRQIFAAFNKAVLTLLGFSDQGAAFIFGNLVNDYKIGAIFAFKVLPTIIFFSSMISVLYYLGVMQKIVQVFAVIMMKILGTSGAETLSCSANIFVGQTEAPLLIKPFVETMTKSELLTIMTGGFATVAGGVMAAYVGMLVNTFPDIAGHLLSASIMNAPGAIVMSKILLPEEDEPATKGEVSVDLPISDANAIDAAANGAGQGLQLALNVGAMLMAFIALIKIIDFAITKISGVLLNNPDLMAAGPFLGDPINIIYKIGIIIAVAALLYMFLEGPWKKMDHREIFIGALVIILGFTLLKGVQSLKAYKILTFLGFGYIFSLGIRKIDAVKKPIEQLGKSIKLTPSTAILSVGMLISFIIVLATNVIGNKYSASIPYAKLDLSLIFGWIFSPIAWVMGVPWKDCIEIGGLFGKRLVINEFVTYSELADMLEKGKDLDPRSVMIVTYAMCGFANFSSIAIQIGGIGGIAPSRRSELARLGLYGVLAGTLATFQSATIAGMLVSKPRMKMPKKTTMKRQVKKYHYSAEKRSFYSYAAKQLDIEAAAIKKILVVKPIKSHYHNVTRIYKTGFKKIITGKYIEKNTTKPGTSEGKKQSV